MLVRFNDQDEFVAELARDTSVVARRLVRATTMTYPIMDGALTRMAVVGTAKVLSQSVGTDGEHYDLVEYTEIAGDLWGHGKDQEVIDRGNRLVTELSRKLTDAGFVVAAGRYENEETMKR